MRKRKKSRNKSEFPARLFLDKYPLNSRFAESYRTLRTNIDFSFMEKELRSLLVTSAGEEEGKTLTVANLAYTISMMGRSVLMIDADMRKPLLSRFAFSQGAPGLTGLLSDVFGTDVKSGSLGQFGTSDLFRLLSLQRRTGSLSLSKGKDEVELIFLQGELVDLNWRTRPEEKKLATFLVNNKLITREQGEQAIVRQKHSGQKLGFVLINMGLVKEEDLTGPLTIHMMEGLRMALQLKDGEFHFKDIPASSYDRGSFDPVDFHRLYKQVILGEEDLPYLWKKTESAILKTDKKNLFLLPCGDLPPNPNELLASERMSFLISILKKRFDILVIDSPPILPTSDALILAPYTDGVVLLIKAGLMNRKMVKKSVEQLQLAQANLIGVVLNQVDMKKDGYYKYYHKYYSKYYGDSA